LRHLEEVFYIEQSKVKFQLAEVCLACNEEEIGALRWLKAHSSKLDPVGLKEYTYYRKQLDSLEIELEKHKKDAMLQYLDMFQV
jgi:hypothetical protein